MNDRGRNFGRKLFVGYVLLLHLAVVLLLADRFLPQYISLTPIPPGRVADPTESSPFPTPLPVPQDLADLPNDQPAASREQVMNELPTGSGPHLIIPVAGVRPEDLTDTFTQARSEGRTHEAIDIPASPGTPVLAASDGRIAKFWDSERGGVTIYQLSSDRKYFYYYAHLQRRAEGLKEGDAVRQGSVIGYVGDTGNAGTGNYHLHFGITTADDPQRYWAGTSINPYPLLRYPSSPQ